MHHLQHITELGPLIKGIGVRHVILAPGSRNAPLIQLFTADKNFKCHSVVDERSAAYVALGMARQLKEPVLVVTTSGTAVMNLSPAVAEAFQQQIPLLVLTADRPRELLSQFNNQVIDQRAPYFNFSKGFFEFPPQLREEQELKQSMRSAGNLLQEALANPAGPVHINLPLMEPLYEPLPSSMLAGSRFLSTTESGISGTANASVPALAGRKVLILAGMGQAHTPLQEALEKAVFFSQTVVVAENISNLRSDFFISTPELVLSGANVAERKALTPDLVIAFGLQLVSKQLKLFIQSLEGVEFLELDGKPLNHDLFSEPAGLAEPENSFFKLWKEIEEREHKRVADYLQLAPFGNLTAVSRLLDAVPPSTVVHLGNSTTIRNSQLLPVRSDLEYYSNRGTSGKDGSL